MAMALVWMKVESKTHPGRYYYFNRSTQTSSWKIPRELAVIEVCFCQTYSVNCRYLNCIFLFINRKLGAWIRVVTMAALRPP